MSEQIEAKMKGNFQLYCNFRTIYNNNKHNTVLL